MPSRKIWIALLLAAAALGGVAVGVVFFQPRPSAPVELEGGTWLSPPRPLPAFALVDQDGRPAGPGVFRGHWTLVFFGFTRCPDACPTTLALLAGVSRELAGTLPVAQQPGVMLVSVDPERDTPAVLKAYLGGFGPGLLGLTGEPEAMRSFATALGVPYRKIPMNGDYMMDHSTAILLVDPDGRQAALFSWPHVSEVLLRDYRRVMATG